MCKPKLVIQHWIDTGNLLFLENFNEKSHSETGSSIIEGFVQLDSAQNSACSSNQSCKKKVTKDAIISTKQSFNLSNFPSNSSNMTTCIIRNAKKENFLTKKSFKNNQTKRNTNNIHNYSSAHFPVKTIIKHVYNKNKYQALEKKTSNFTENSIFLMHESLIDDVKNFEQSSISKNLTINHNQMKNSSTQKNSSSSSTGSVLENSQKNFNQCISELNDLHEKINVKKILKRKKLYNFSRSPVELTPTSEDNLSVKNHLICFKKRNHPALETPQVLSKNLTRYKKKYRKKCNNRLTFLVKLNKENNSLWFKKSNKNFNEKYFYTSKSSQFSCDFLGRTDNIDYTTNKNSDYKNMFKTNSDVQMKNFIKIGHESPSIYQQSSCKLPNSKILDNTKKSIKNNLDIISQLNISVFNDDEFFCSVDKLFNDSIQNRTCFKKFGDLESKNNIKFVNSQTLDTNNKQNLLNSANSIHKSQSMLNISDSFKPTQSSRHRTITAEKLKIKKNFMETTTRYGIVLSSDESDEL